MKLKPLRHQLSYQRITLSYLLFALFILSCKNEKIVEVKDLEFTQETYYIPEGDHATVYVASGNQQYSLSGFDEAIISPAVSNTDFPAGVIYITGLKKGKTEMTVKDEVSGQEVQLTIHVVDPFLVMEASDVFPMIKDQNDETARAIWEHVRTEPQGFFGFETREVLVLQQNADNRFWVFKNGEDAARGITHKSGKFTLTFSYGGPNRLRLDYEDSDEPIEYALFTPHQPAFSSLLRWAQNGDAENSTVKNQSNALKAASIGSPSAEMPQNTSPVDNSPQLFLIKDFTSFFKESYPTVERVELFQRMRFYGQRQHLKIAEGILN